MNDAEQVFTDAHQTNQSEGGGSIPTARLLKSEWEVRKCNFDTARQLVQHLHYSKGASRQRVLSCGLWKKDKWLDVDCLGATLWIPPTKDAGERLFPADPQAVLALSRVVVHPSVPKNACSFLIRHSMRFIDRTRWRVLVTYADSWQGHDGAIYRALADAGWKYDGETSKKPTYVNNQGRMISCKRGHRTFTHKEMLEQGCTLKGYFSRKRFVHRLES